MTEKDVHGSQGEHVDVDASPTEHPEHPDLPDTTDENGRPIDNPSG